MELFLPDFDSAFSTNIFWFFCVVSMIQFLYTTLVYSRLSFHKNREISKTEEGVSIIIAARNESENIFNHLPFILEQNYPKFEVIVINHQSTDDSKYILDAYKRQYPHLRIIEIEKSVHLKYGKKLPITVGVKGAKYERLLFTDADCKPNSHEWLQSMSKHFTDKKQIVLGYGPYIKRKGWVNKMIRFDTAWIAMNYLSLAKAKIPYMGVGRNMAYTKSIFNEVGGFKSHYSISSGDDDLFIQEAAKKKNYTINVEEKSFCFSEPPETWKQWMNQKSRHFTTSHKYTFINKVMLGIYPMTLLLMLSSFVFLMLDEDFRWLSLVVFGFVFLIKWLILGLAMRKLKEKSFILFIPVLDILYAIFAPILYYSIEKKGKNKW